MLKTGIVKDHRYLNYDPGIYHPESPQRLEVIYAMLGDSNMVVRFQAIPDRRAEREKILLIHSPEYFNMVAGTEGKDYFPLDPAIYLPAPVKPLFWLQECYLMPYLWLYEESLTMLLH